MALRKQVQQHKDALDELTDKFMAQQQILMAQQQELLTQQQALLALQLTKTSAHTVLKSTSTPELRRHWAEYRKSIQSADKKMQ